MIPLGLVYWGIKRSTAPADSHRRAGASGRLEGEVTVRSAIDSVGDPREQSCARWSPPRWGAADPDVVEAIAARLQGGDGAAWVQEWTAEGGAAWAAARHGRSGSAYLHAASYYAAALALIDESDGLVEEDRLWERQRECWDRAAGGSAASACRLPTSAGRCRGISSRRVRAQAVGGHRSRWPGGHVFGMGGGRGRGGSARVPLDDVRRAGPPGDAAPAGPGAATRLGSGARSGGRRDDRPCERDASRMAVIGIDHAGYGVARALAFEPRFAAAVLAPGIVDASRPWVAALPAPARAALLDEDREWFDRELHLATLFAPEIADRLRRLAREYDLSGLPLYDLARRIASSGSTRRSAGRPHRCSPAQSGPSRCGQSRPRSCARDCRAPSWPAAGAGRGQRLGLARPVPVGLITVL